VVAGGEVARAGRRLGAGLLALEHNLDCSFAVLMPECFLGLTGYSTTAYNPIATRRTTCHA
jgi:hypothetical protein